MSENAQWMLCVREADSIGLGLIWRDKRGVTGLTATTTIRIVTAIQFSGFYYEN